MNGASSGLARVRRSLARQLGSKAKSAYAYANAHEKENRRSGQPIVALAETCINSAFALVRRRHATYYFLFIATESDRLLARRAWFSATVQLDPLLVLNRLIE